MRSLFSAVVLSLLLSSCFGTSEIVPCGPDTYTVTSATAGFSDGKVRATVYQRANEFCAKRHLVMVPVSIDSQRGEYGKRPPVATLVFRALQPGDPEIKRPIVDRIDQTVRVLQR